MVEENKLTRRSFLGTAAASIVAAEMSFMGAAYANTGQPKRLQPLQPIKQIKAGVLDIGYYDIGASDGPPVLLLHGWLPLYPKWQEYFRKHQPPVLIAWGKNDQIFPAAGAEPYKRDLKTLEYHLLDAGHFALETNGDEIAKLMRDFLGKHVARK